jgi:hypothetical protein
MTNELHIPQTAIFLSRMLLAWLGLLRLDFTADMNGFYRPLAIKNLPSSSGFENFFDHFFTISLLNTTYTESIKENLSMLSSSSTPHKIFTKKIFGLKPQQYGSRFNKIAQLAWTRLGCSRFRGDDPVKRRKQWMVHAWKYPLEFLDIHHFTSAFEPGYYLIVAVRSIPAKVDIPKANPTSILEQTQPPPSLNG